MKSGVYRIRNTVNDKIYVGSAVSIKKRWHVHKSCLRNNKHKNHHLQRSWNKHGEGSFEFDVLEHWEPEFLVSFEQWWMNMLRPEYNIFPTAGSPLGRKHSEEAKAKMSKAAMGRKHTEEARANMGKAQTGNTNSLGYTQSEEHKAKISKAKAGENSYSAKLTAKQVRQIRKLYATGQYTQKTLGNAFGVSGQQIGKIIGRKAWKHIN